MPDFVQNVYTRVQANGLPGTVYDGNPIVVNSFVAETEIPFGRAVSQGSKFGPPRSVRLGGGTISATAGYHIGSAITGTIGQFQAITNGSMVVIVDGTTKNLTSLNFSSAADFAAVATALTTAITSAVATFTFDTTTQTFKITSATTGSSSKIGAITDYSSGTSIRALMGFDTEGITVDGVAQYTATMIGVSVRSLSAEAKSLEQSNITVVKAGDVGAYMKAGYIKVLAKESVSGGASVYYDTTTGEFYGSSGAGRSSFGSSKWQFPASEGEVGVIEVAGF